jgi:hypothetical protein
MRLDAPRVAERLVGDDFCADGLAGSGGRELVDQREGEAGEMPEVLVEVLEEKQGSLRVTGWAKAVRLPAEGAESLARERTEVVVAAFGTRTSDASDARTTLVA